MLQEKLTAVLLRSLFGIILGIAYSVVALDPAMLTASAIGGMLIGLLTAILDQWLFSGRLRRRRFTTVLLVRTLSYFFVISFVLLLIAGNYIGYRQEVSFSQFWDPGALGSQLSNSKFPEIVGVSFVLLLVVQFIALVSRLLGRNVLLNYLLGRYYHPKEEERIFMFVDMKSSTHIAEKLGHLEWHRLLNDYFFDIAEPIRRTKGEIYQYVGDEVVITWPKKRGVANLNCIRCFFLIEAKMKAKRTRYLNRYGFEPVFKAGYHIGKVVAGEIGDYKRSIVFHGDTINTASRIQAETNRIGRRLLLSGELLKELDLGNEYKEEFIGKIILRGKAHEVTLFSIDPTYIKLSPNGSSTSPSPAPQNSSPPSTSIPQSLTEK